MAKSHSDEIQRLIVNAAAQGNILPITSRCDTRCVFCSHKNNPPEIDVIYIGVRTLDEIAQTMNYLDPRQVITIGDSASSIVEGEPFTHPGFREVLATLRSRFPSTPVEITTNGHELTSSMVDFLAGLGNLSLNISLNSASVEGRRLLMGDTREQTEQTLAGIEMLARQGVPYGSSIVAMPYLTGWDDMRDTIQFLSDRHATVIRVCMSGFSTRASSRHSRWRYNARATARVYLQLIGRAILPGADRALLCRGPDRRGQRRYQGFSRVACGNSAWRSNPLCEWEKTALPRGGVEDDGAARPPADHCQKKWSGSRVFLDESTSWRSRRGHGIRLRYGASRKYHRLILHQPGKTLLLASEFGHAVLRAILESFHLPGKCAEVIPVKNLTFGGTIKASGLLTVDDYDAALKNWQAQANEKPGQLLVPGESFNSLGFDLKHRHYAELEGLTQIPVKLA